MKLESSGSLIVAAMIATSPPSFADPPPQAQRSKENGKPPPAPAPRPAAGSPANPASKPAAAPAKPEDKPGPKIVSISPAMAVIDHASSIELTLRGSGFEDVKPLTITYETDPSRGGGTCATAKFITDTELRCTIEVRAGLHATLDEELPVDQGLHFAVSWIGKDKKVVTGSSSSATFTPHATLLADRLCAAGPGSGDVQLRLHVPGAIAGLKVRLEKLAGKTATAFPCAEVQPFGTSDLVCYVSAAFRELVGQGLIVSVERPIELDATNLKTPTMHRASLRSLGSFTDNAACGSLDPIP